MMEGTSEREEPAESVPDDEREALVTIAHAAVVTSGGYTGKRLLTTAVEIVLARGLGPIAYGVYALAWRVVQLLARLVTFGSTPALQRYLPAYEGDDRRRALVVGLAYATTLGFGAALLAGVWVVAPWANTATIDQPSFPATMRAFGVAVVLIGVIRITAGTFRAIESASGEVLLNKLLQPAVRLCAAVIALALGYSVVGVSVSIVVAIGLLAGSSAPLAVRITGIRPSLRGARSELRRFYNHAAPVAMSGLGKIFQNRLDVLLVGSLLTAVATGVYNVVLVLIAIAWIPLRSFNQLLPPVASDLYANGRVDVLNAVYSSVTRLTVTTVTPIVLVLVVYGPELLGLFGEPYRRGYAPLVIYLGGVCVGSTVGATGWLLMMTDHQYARMALDWFLAVLNVALTYVFIVHFGINGAALGTSLAIAIQNGLQVLLLRHYEGLWPFDRTFLTPIGAGLVTLPAMWLLRMVVPGFLAVVVGSVVGVGVYLVALRTFGVDSRDKLVAKELVRRYWSEDVL